MHVHAYTIMNGLNMKHFHQKKIVTLHFSTLYNLLLLSSTIHTLYTCMHMHVYIYTAIIKLYTDNRVEVAQF